MGRKGILAEPGVERAAGTFPAVRLRRLRASEGLRSLIRETRLTPDRFVYPIFVHELEEDVGIESMPGQSRIAISSLPRLVRRVHGLGIPAVILFGVPLMKDDVGSGAYDPHGVVQRAVATIKDVEPDLVVIADTCLDEYTSHGHCGLVRDGDVDNDATLDLLARAAVSQAEAGVDLVAPSDMMDGRVAAIRRALDETGHSSVPIMSYAAKYASAFYGPFREAAASRPQFGDRRSYQMDPANGREAIREVAQDVAEGADAVLVKPATPYLDVVRDVRTNFEVPVGAYQVSGEYAMIRGAAMRGWLDERAAALESLTSIVRAGADFVLTYFALDASEWLTET
ncbi:MAG TPA: porphobilinogen synthase [Chloroflexota bacterium]|nr:porphobilinogen synthase [Chloroflexota bacterium]